MKVALRLRRQSRRHLVQNVDGLVHPAPLFPGRVIDLSESGPEAQGPVFDGELPWLREPPLLEVEEQFLLSRTPSMTAISSFWPFGRGAHEDEQALLFVALVFQPLRAGSPVTAASMWGPGVHGTRKEPCTIRETERHGEANHDARGGRAVRMPSGKIVTTQPAVRVEA
jgi:hypothetical protein